MTTNEIRAMRDEAAEAGDVAQVAICDRALRGDVVAIAECERVQRDAQGQGDSAATTQDEDVAHGLTFAAWLRRAGGYEHVIEQGVDARVAWRAGEDPAEYAMQEAS